MSGWDDLEAAAELPQKFKDADEIARLYLRVFSGEDGAKVLEHLRALTIEAPTWFPGHDPSFGFAREGQNQLVRDIEAKLKRARQL
jgi:hypothetical protein